jgi:DNA polymerase-3 subunit gamma/tau
MRSVSSSSHAAAIAPDPQTGTTGLASFEEVVALFGQKREGMLQAHLSTYVHLVKFEQGHIALRLKDGAPHNLVGQMSEKLSAWTGRPWVVSLSRETGGATLAESRKGEEKRIGDEVRASPAVAEALKTFPGAKVIDIRSKG